MLEHRGGRWQAVEQLPPRLLEVFSIVTAFTVAHSITLSLAVLGFIALPSRLIEFDDRRLGRRRRAEQPLPADRKAAVDRRLCLRPGARARLCQCADRARACPNSALAVSLVSFNLGVEAGQLAIVAMFLPLAYLSRRSWLYPRLVLGAGSCAIVAVASVG